MILSARYVRKPRTHYVCDWCERGIVGPLIYLYGMAEIGMRPYPLRYHVQCCRLLGDHAKIRAALARSDTPKEEPER